MSIVLSAYRNMREIAAVQSRVSSLSFPEGRPWMAHIGLAIVVGVTYFFAAQMSLILLTKPDGVAVFWPAAGISAGTMLALGASVRLPVTVGVVTASVAASL